MKKTMLILVLLLISIAFFKHLYAPNNKPILRHNSIIKEELSPDKRYKAIKFTRDFGATTAISYHLSIIEADEYLEDKAGNVYISDCDFEFEWANNTVIIKEESTAKVYKKKEKLKSVNIVYE